MCPRAVFATHLDPSARCQARRRHVRRGGRRRSSEWETVPTRRRIESYQMIARATNPARYPLAVRRIATLAALLTCVAIGAPAVSARGVAEHTCAGDRCEAAAAAPAIT